MAEKNRVFVVLDPTCMEQAALEWGEQIARQFGANTETVLHVYCCVSEDSVAMVAMDDSAHAQVETEKRVRAWVDRLVVQPRIDGLEVETEVEWHHDWRKAIVVAAERAGSALVVKNMTQHSRFVRMIRETSDWALIRECQCPVLLVKTGRPYAIEKVLVAVKHSDEAAYEKANDNILAAARRITADLGATLHAVTAYSSTDTHPDRQRFADRCGLERAQVSADMGAPEKVIAETATRLGADLLVIARVANPESSKEMGGTAKKVIDEIDTEVLILPVAS